MSVRYATLQWNTAYGRSMSVRHTTVKHCIWKIDVCPPHYSETLHMEDRCLYATLQWNTAYGRSMSVRHTVASIQPPSRSHTPLSNDRSSISGVKGEGGGGILLINIVTLTIHQQTQNAAVQRCGSFWPWKALNPQLQYNVAASRLQ